MAPLLASTRRRWPGRSISSRACPLSVLPPAADRRQGWRWLGTYLLENKTRIPACWCARRRLEPADGGGMGVRVGRGVRFVFALARVLAALAGALMALDQRGADRHGREAILIPALVVIVIGGIHGSVRGAFGGRAAGGDGRYRRARLPATCAARGAAAPVAADLGPALAGIAMYVLMAAVLTPETWGCSPRAGMRAAAGADFARVSSRPAPLRRSTHAFPGLARRLPWLVLALLAASAARRPSGWSTTSASCAGC